MTPPPTTHSSKNWATCCIKLNFTPRLPSKKAASAWPMLRARPTTNWCVATRTCLVMLQQPPQVTWSRPGTKSNKLNVPNARHVRIVNRNTQLTSPTFSRVWRVLPRRCRWPKSCRSVLPRLGLTGPMLLVPPPNSPKKYPNCTMRRRQATPTPCVWNLATCYSAW